MTKDDIIKAAFKVWGQDLYRTTSLTEIALNLGVSKTALYRHFRNKDALMDAMYGSFFDDCADFIREGFKEAFNTSDKQKMYIILFRTVTEYFVRNRYAFAFFLIKASRRKDGPNVHDEFCGRGIDFDHPALAEFSDFPSTTQLGMITLIFYTANFHHRNLGEEYTPDDQEVKGILKETEDVISNGLSLNRQIIDALNYLELEERAGRIVHEDTEENVLLRAVAAAVAEAGPWNASMEMVSKHSGLSKSGLYAHFKNKQDMIAQLFVTELTKIANHAKIQVESSCVSEEQLYLAIISIINYLRARPEILEAIDWIKTRKLNLGKNVSGYLSRIIGDIKIEAIQNYDRHKLVQIAQWVLFMIVNALALWRYPENQKMANQENVGWDVSWSRNLAEIPNESFRKLFRFIALGLGGSHL